MSKDTPYRLVIENAMQGPKCFESFEAVLGDYTIGRTYNVYGKEAEVEFMLRIPSDICKEDREYKMICVTENGQAFIYDDLDDNPYTITIRTNKFYAYGRTFFISC